MNTIKRIVWISSVILILVSSAGRGAHAEEAADKAPQTTQTEAGSLLVEAESAGSFRYEEEEEKLYIYGGTVCIKLNPSVDYSRDKIEVSGYATLVLNGVRIIAENGPALRVIPGADAEIRLAGGEKPEEGDAPVMENFLQGAEGYAGIEAGALPGGEGSLLEANLRIKGKGYLAAIGGDGAAAIGASRGQYACGLISIEEGNITAVAGKNADAIGCGAECDALPSRAPLIFDKTISLLALSDGTGHAFTDAMPKEDGEKADAFPKGSAPASILTAVLPGYAEESMSDSSDVRVRDTQGNGEISFSMPEGYREFAVKTDANCEYMVEQDGRIFAGSKEESEEIDEDAVLFRGTTDYTEETLYLTPLSQNPAIDIFVTGLWEDDDDNDGTRPESVNVTLYANGKETGRTITLSEENDWSGTFEELSVYSDCVRQSYSVVEERLEGYTGLISGSDLDGYTITNSHEPLPEGRSGEEEISLRSRGTIEEGKIVATVLTTKVSRSMPARTSTTIKKTHSAKTADSSNTLLWGGMLLMAVIALFIWMRIEQSKE